MEDSARYYQTTKEGDVTIAFNPKIPLYSYFMFSGVNYDIDISQPECNRIKNATINGKPLDKIATYKLAVNNFIFGKLINKNFTKYDDVYYESFNENPSTISDFIIKYINEELNGEITPECDYNWKIIGLPKSFNDPETIEKIKNGEIKIPRSSDGKAINVEPVRIDTEDDEESDIIRFIKSGYISLSNFIFLLCIILII